MIKMTTHQNCMGKTVTFIEFGEYSGVAVNMSPEECIAELERLIQQNEAQKLSGRNKR